eukprot:GHVH01011106.1.p1 GENE.GHVH01011106.1~~GHVH01011106.1.p1  ORF type:complete len:377 (+),score=66.58 GHVH01011106.1:41-1171(+)
MDPQKSTNEDLDLESEGPVRLRRNKSSEVTSESAGVTSGSLTLGGAPTGSSSGVTIFDRPGPVVRGQRRGSGSGGAAFMNNAFKPNVIKALASESKRIGGDWLKVEDRAMAGGNLEDIGDILNSSIGRGHGAGGFNKTPGNIAFTGGGMDAMNIRGARPPRKAPNSELNVRAFHEHTRIMERRRQQMNASKEEKGGVGLMDLPFLDDAPYPPVVVPYLMSEASIGDTNADGTPCHRSKFTTKFIDENNRKAGLLLFSSLLNDADAIKEEETTEWFLMQFPWRLPEGPGQAKNISDLHSGRIGELVVHQSGAVELVLERHAEDLEEPIRLDVNVGAESAFHQQVASYDTVNNELIILGDISKRMVLTPHMRMQNEDD